jgi:hypothetical protein
MRNMPGASGELSVAGAPQQDAGNGITRINAPGQSPLFTNMAASDPSNVGLMARGPVSAQNQMAMDGIQARQDAGDQARMQRFQYDQDVAAANAVNKWQAEERMRPKQRLGMRKLEMEDAANKSRMGLDAMRMGIDERRAGEDAATGALTREAAQMGVNKAKQIESLQQQYLATGNDPAKQKAIAQQLAVLSGKGESGKWAIQVTPPTKNIDGTTTPGSVYRYNTATGEVIPVEGGAGGQQGPQGQQQTFINGQTYIDAQGNKSRYENGEWKPVGK